MEDPQNPTRRTVVKLAGLGAAGAISGINPAQGGDRNANFDKVIDEAIASQRIVGGVLLVSEHGKVVFQRAAGLADRETGRVMTLDTPFRFASVTKPFTTMAAIQLLAKGRLSSDDPVSRHLPDFKLRLADGTPAEPTVGHLMAHMAGLDYGFQQPADSPYARAGVSDGLDRSVPALAENLRRLATVPLDIKPGTAWRYSVATDVLGAVIQSVTGQSLDVAIHDLVGKPLGLDVRFHWPEAELAAAYRNANSAPARMSGLTEVPLLFIEGTGVRFDPERIGDAMAWPSGGAGAAGRAADVLTLLEAFRTGDFLAEDWRAKARAVRAGAEAQAQGPGWGFSWLGAVLVDPAVAGSSWSEGSVSWGGVYGSTWGVDFERGRSFVSLTNTTMEGLFGKYPQDIAAAFGKLN